MGSALRADHEDTTGADWRRWDRVMRLVYVRAVADTSSNLLAGRILASNPYIPMSGGTIGDIVEAIDKFYATSENRQTSVVTAMRVVAAKLNDAS
jgi:hypothetical protein